LSPEQKCHARIRFSFISPSPSCRAASPWR
jgi:hypothetical protein